MFLPPSRDSGTWTAISLEYGVYEQCEQEAERKAPAIRSPALQNEQWSSGGVHARDLARTAGTYPVPVVIVPANLSEAELDALS